MNYAPNKYILPSVWEFMQLQWKLRLYSVQVHALEGLLVVWGLKWPGQGGALLMGKGMLCSWKGGKKGGRGTEL